VLHGKQVFLKCVHCSSAYIIDLDIHVSQEQNYRYEQNHAKSARLAGIILHEVRIVTLYFINYSFFQAYMVYLTTLLVA
jgi:hypothetical protein